MTPTLQMEDLLGGLGSEQELPKRELNVEERSPALDAICDGIKKLLPTDLWDRTVWLGILPWLQWWDEGKRIGHMHLRRLYNCKRFIPVKGRFSWLKRSLGVACGAYSAKDVEMFSLIMHQYYDEKVPDAGKKLSSYLNSLCALCPEDSITVYTHALNTPLDSLGVFNTRDLVVNGPVGAHLGLGMKCGSIELHGNAEGDGHNTQGAIGQGMCGGQITVYGNVGYVGTDMRGGEVVVRGDVGKFLGYRMRGGVIHIEGEYESLCEDIRGGDIYHKGIQIVKDGKRV